MERKVAKGCGGLAVILVISCFSIWLWWQRPAIGQVEKPVIHLHLLDFRVREGDRLFETGYAVDRRLILESRVIDGGEAREIILLINEHLNMEPAISWCPHAPVYGIVIEDADELVLKTSLCFGCNKWTLSGGLRPIRGDRGKENALAIRLREELEFPDYLDSDLTEP